MEQEQGPNGTAEEPAVGRYLFDNEVGSGPLGPLWLAQATEGSTAGASFTVRRVGAGGGIAPHELEELERAAAWAMRLEGGDLRTTIDIVRDDNEVIVVMPRLEGRTLGALLRAAESFGNPIAEPVAARILLDLCGELEALYEASRQVDSQGEAGSASDMRYVFGGLTPDSVMIGADGVAHIFDIGISAAAARTEAFGQLPERAAYFAPEQLDGVSDARTDVFATGLILWEMLAARRPYRAVSFRTLATKIRTATVPHLSHVARAGAPPVADAIGDLVARALKTDSHERFSGPKDLAEALEAVIEPVSHREVALVLRLVRPSSIPPKRPSQPFILPPMSSTASLAQLAESDGVEQEDATSDPFADEITQPNLQIPARDNMPTLDVELFAEIEAEPPSVGPPAVVHDRLEPAPRPASRVHTAALWVGVLALVGVLLMSAWPVLRASGVARDIVGETASVAAPAESPGAPDRRLGAQMSNPSLADRSTSASVNAEQSRREESERRRAAGEKPISSREESTRTRRRVDPSAASSDADARGQLPPPERTRFVPTGI